MLSENFEEIVQRRRSNRRFDPNFIVADEIIEKSLQRAILSPNSSNMQLWEFYWIKSEEAKNDSMRFASDNPLPRTPNT